MECLDAVAMKFLNWKLVRRAVGADWRYWPLVAVVVFAFSGLFLSLVDLRPQVRLVDVGPPDPRRVAVMDSPSLVGSDEIDVEAVTVRLEADLERRRRLEALGAERRRRVEADHIRREGAVARAAQLARAEEQLAALRARRMRPEPAPEAETSIGLLVPRAAVVVVGKACPDGRDPYVDADGEPLYFPFGFLADDSPMDSPVLLVACREQ